MKQLANVLRKAGEPDKANAILYKSREQARKRARTDDPRIVTRADNRTHIVDTGKCVHGGRNHSMGLGLLGVAGYYYYFVLCRGCSGPINDDQLRIALEAIVALGFLGSLISIFARFGGLFVGLTLINWTIGYGLGLKYFRSLGWVATLTLLGAGILLNSGEWHVPGTLFGFGPWPVSGEKSAGVVAAFIYSLQTLLPFTEIQKFENVHLTGFVAVYFLIHRLLGYALAAFLAAGVAGLTQKS
jgi:hypothetical protein